MRHELTVPDGATGLVIFNLGAASGLGRAQVLQTALIFNRYKLATLIPGSGDGVEDVAESTGLPLGHFTSGQAVMTSLAAAEDGNIQAIVSFCGDIDVNADCISRVEQPVLLIACGRDSPGIRNNREALSRLNGVSSMNVVSRASRQLLEPGTLEEMAELAALWFCRHLE